MNVQDQPHVKMTARRSLASIRRPTQDGPVSEARADVPVPYQYPLSAVDVTVRSAPSPANRLYPKTLTVFLDASPSGKHRAIHAAALAQR